ncbi:calcium/sodium antiporter [Aureibaculum sp. 2210JD6-5]|uniref:calcium/sodium antiporter n=1 Tax=Aureibaculum sp. 2210JD6-5 TaxID=3103957 RepID=UPI002AAD6706|nr:calcium/sodium antiporter [Aureibaculum sp. 2210JD6-5]MDY7394906.1 calcium/sodium antiporter [Aureibaculum sp. 2210JD6-5]
MSIFYLIVGLVLLVIGGEFLVRSSVGLSFKLKLSKIVIGMTVVSFATSAPELLVSLQAALDGHPDLALSNVVGSNIANIALVLGITAIISPLMVDKDFYKMNWPMMVILSIALYFFLVNDNVLTQIEGGILFISLVVFIYFMIRASRKFNKNAIIEEVDESLSETSGTKIFIWLIIGGLALYFGSELLVKGAVDIATKLGVSERVIGVSMVALGTSVPELAASVIAALRKEKAISLGNLIGSNIFNIASVLGLTAIITPINVIDKGLLTNDIIWMLVISIILLPLVLLPKKLEISRFKGLLLLFAYITFIYLSFKAS